MKRYIIIWVIVDVFYIVITWLPDRSSDEVRSFGSYALHLFIFVILGVLSFYLDKNGWNSWSRFWVSSDGGNRISG